MKPIVYLISMCIAVMTLGCNGTPSAHPSSSSSTKLTKVLTDTLQNSHEFYIGTYTTEKSDGIYKSSLSATGKIAPPFLVANTSDPSYLALSSDNTYLLAVNEVKRGTIQSYKTTSPALTLISKKPSGGIHPCHITIDNSGSILTSNYSSGTIGLHQLDGDGTISNLQFVDQHKGTGKHSRQEGPHAHSAYFLDNDIVVSADLGSNDLWFSSLNREEKKLDGQYNLPMKDGAGPRHIAIHPHHRTLLVLNELDCTVSTISIDKKDNKYHITHTVSTLPNGYTGENTCADIHISSDGKFAYVSNRGHNSIAIFSLDEQSNANLIGHEPTRGMTPRNFALSPDQRHLLVANQKSNSLVSFQRDINTGLLTFVDKVEAYTPVCILFEN